MKHKTWFRLVLQAIGVLLIGFGAPEFVAAGVSWFWYYGTVGGLMDSDEWWHFALHVGPYALQTAFGVYLLAGAPWLLNKIIPSNRPYCPECGYDLTHNTGEKCVECGVTLPGDVAKPMNQTTAED